MAASIFNLWFWKMLLFTMCASKLARLFKRQKRDVVPLRCCKWNLTLTCLFVSLFGIFRLTWNFSLILIRHNTSQPGKGCKFWPMLGMAIEQWGFFSVPHPLWHGASVYNGHLRGLVIPERFGSGAVTT